ncbi:MAG: hypothetical protein Kow001_08260 [Acidobacteriota bacterium]
MADPSNLRSAATSATIVAFLMIANQVAGKATRDALFLSQFDVTSLPTMLMAGAALSLAAVLGVSRLMSRHGPARLVPAIFAASAALLLLQWWLAVHQPRIAAVLLYFHVAVFGSILISGFWSFTNELFDPRSGKRMISRIATGGAVGGLAGGVLAERVAADLDVPLMLPLLGVMHLISAVLLFRMPAGGPGGGPATADSPSGLRALFGLLRRQSYLHSLAMLVLAGTACAALIDYLFKEQAVQSFPEEGGLLRFFAIYYTVISLLGVLFQGGLSRVALQKLGVVRTAGILPATLALGGLANLVLPALATAIAARAGEAVLRNSLWRSAYELLYTPVPPAEKRAVKTVIDVGFERLGDALGGGLVRVLLLLAPAVALPLLPITAGLLGLLGLVAAVRLHRGYIQTLERSLRTKAVELDLDQIEDRTTRRTMMQTLGAIDVQELGLPEAEDAPAASPVSPLPRRKGPAEQLEALRSGDVQQVLAVLHHGDLYPLLVPQVIQLLAWDAVAVEAIRVLRRLGLRITGQLVDALLDLDQDFTIRRRIPRVLASIPTQRAAEGLLAGLRDPRFEVRYQCGRALLHITSENPEIRLPADAVVEVVEREVSVDRPVWESHRLLDQLEVVEDQPQYLDDLVRDRAGKSLEHVFTVLSLILPREPLQIAFRGLHTDDPGLRGTALEYLESVLPERIRSSLWPFLEARPEAEVMARSREEVLEDLLRSHESIQISLKHLRDREG